MKSLKKNKRKTDGPITKREAMLWAHAVAEACPDGLKRFTKYESVKEWWEQDNHFDDKVWVVEELNGTQKTQRLILKAVRAALVKNASYFKKMAKRVKSRNPEATVGSDHYGEGERIYIVLENAAKLLAHRKWGKLNEIGGMLIRASAHGITYWDDNILLLLAGAIDGSRRYWVSVAWDQAPTKGALSVIADINAEVVKHISHEVISQLILKSIDDHLGSKVSNIYLDSRVSNIYLDSRRR